MGTIEVTGEEAVKYLNKINNSLGYLNQYVLDSEVIELKEPVIVKSGDTYVTRFEGIDYLCICPTYCNNILERRGSLLIGDIQQSSRFLPFSEIEITDDIAKLRPIVIYSRSGTCDILYAVDGNGDYITGKNHTDKCYYRLATVKDLEGKK